MKRHGCLVCGYRYDPQKGDKFTGVQPDTAFEVLAEDWRCPICRAGKTSFEPLPADEGENGSAGKSS